MSSDEFAEKHPMLFLFLAGLVSFSFSIWLLIIPIIGVPLMLFGLFMIVVSILGKLGFVSQKYINKISNYKKQKADTK